MKPNDQKPIIPKSPNEIPEKKKSEEEVPAHRHELEVEQPQSGNDATYSEEHDVTPPNPHEFPSVGNAETDFVSAGKHGRKTSRMTDHEPGL